MRSAIGSDQQNK